MEKINELENQEVSVEHFSTEGHKYIFIAMMYLYSKKIKPTPLTILEVITSESARKAIEDLGGLEYLTALTEVEIPTENLPFFIGKIKQSFARKMLYNIAEEVMDFVISPKSEILNPQELISHVEAKLDDLSVNTSVSEEVYKMGDKTEEVLEERSKHPAKIPGIETGWEEFDRLTNGGQPGDLIIVCAPSKTGKSVTLTNWATKIAIHDKMPILYFDTEMNEREQEDRILTNLTGIPHSEIISGGYVLDSINGKAEEKIAKLKKTKEMLGTGHYYHIYLPHFTIEKVTALSRKFMNQIGIKAIFFDYIKIPSSQADFKSMQEYQALGFFTSGLKDLAGTLKIPVFTACQANRSDLNSNSPDASMIGGSYRILQLATKLIFLTNKSPEDIAKQGIINGNQQLWIKYQRNGASDCSPINIMFDKAILRQREAK